MSQNGEKFNKMPEIMTKCLNCNMIFICKNLGI